MAKQGKGSAYEREICAALSEWWSGGEHSDLFWRTSQSGGRATTRAKKGKTTRAHSGDICALDHVGAPLTELITIEAKRGYNKATIHDCLDKGSKAKKQMYEEFIIQAKDAAERAKTPYWMVIHKRDRREPVCSIPFYLFKKLGFDMVGMGNCTAASDICNEVVYSFPFADFLNQAEPNDIRLLLKQYKKYA